MSSQNKNKDVVAVLLPAKNEAITIRETIVRFHQTLPDAKLVVIDNNSTDATSEIAQSTLDDLKCDGVLMSVTQAGKGNALRHAFETIQADAYLICDADLTYPIEEAPGLLEKIFVAGYDMAIGERISLGHYRQHNKRRFHYTGNRLVTSLINLLFKQQYCDVASGFRAVSHSFVKNYEVRASGFEFEIDISIHAAVTKAAVTDVPITYLDRPEGSHSKLNTYSDGLNYLTMIFSRFIAHTIGRLRQA